jgi:hypothetical protein
MDMDHEELVAAYERRLEQKRDYYLKNKGEILANMKEKYNKKKEEKIASGIVPARRGRPRKFQPPAE